MRINQKALTCLVVLALMLTWACCGSPGFTAVSPHSAGKTVVSPNLSWIRQHAFAGKSWKEVSHQSGELAYWIFIPVGSDPNATDEMVLVTYWRHCVLLKGNQRQTLKIFTRLHPQSIQLVTHEPIQWKVLRQDNDDFMAQWQVKPIKAQWFAPPQFVGLTRGWVSTESCIFADYVTEQVRWTPILRSAMMGHMKALTGFADVRK